MKPKVKPIHRIIALLNGKPITRGENIFATICIIIFFPLVLMAESLSIEDIVEKLLSQT